MKNAKLLLEQLTELMPPGEGQCHNITVDNEELSVSLMFGQRYIHIKLQDENLNAPVNELANKICRFAKAHLT